MSQKIDKLVNKILISNKKNIIGFYAVWIFIGLSINRISPFPQNGIFHIIVVNLMGLLEIFILQRYHMKIRSFKQEISGLKKKESCESLSVKLEKHLRFANQGVAYAAGFFIGILYNYSMYELGIIPLPTAIGIYGCISVIMTVFWGIRGYIHFFILIVYTYKIKKSDSDSYHYNILCPGDTKWLKELALLFRYLKNGFFILGIFYTLEYVISMKSDFFTNGAVTTPNNLLFFITWGIIFVSIVCAYPVLVIVQKEQLRSIIIKYKENTISQIDNYAKKRSKLIKDDSYFFNLEKALSLRKGILNSKSYPVNDKIIIDIASSISALLINAYQLYNILNTVLS